MATGTTSFDIVATAPSVPLNQSLASKTSSNWLLPPPRGVPAYTWWLLMIGGNVVATVIVSTTLLRNSHNDISTTDKEEEVIVDDDLGERRRAEVKHNIVFVTFEATPYSKTGSLGDVCGSLPITGGHCVMVVSPISMCGGPSDKKFDAVVDQDCRIKVSCYGGSNLQISLFSS
ncbi:hypothetical protein L6452_43774 [Arctium lappa]|uniref:Uncharacterized protein n=1 Tax=Arctium lappa TaxID=4217 RepID=A0ACB8XEI8_ARCLA|nr:hypothetical protein L6452_43774 [Arctium lappa]